LPTSLETTESDISSQHLDVASRPGPLQRLRIVWAYRELLANFTRKELKVKYKNSALGFVWSLLNPALYLVVFYVVFQIILQNKTPYFAIFLLAGLLPWNLFSTGLGGATGSIVVNAGLVGKVWFPREILPLASIGAALVHFFLQLIVLFAALLVFRYQPGWGFLWLLVPALITLLVFTAALGIALSAVNVYMRDTSHLLELVLLAWFWMTPIVYQYQMVAKQLADNGLQPILFLLNPMTDIVITFQRAIYGKPTVTIGGVETPLIPDASSWWYLRNLGIVLAVSAALGYFGLWLFGRLEDNLAEEL
jgi:ABC-2 type transport system permease protein